VANPLATILSGAMMLDWLGDRHGDKSCLRAAARVEQAVSSVLEEGKARTRDMGGVTSTSEMARIVNQHMK
jgi:3-isopropylmalate dehydrogenase